MVCPVVIGSEIQGTSKDMIRIFMLAAQREACFGRTVELVCGRQKTFQSCRRLQIDVPGEQRETIVELKALIPNKAIEFDTLGLCRARVNNQRGIRGVVGIVAIPVSVRRKAGGLGLKIFELREDRKSTRLNSSH